MKLLLTTLACVGLATAPTIAQAAVLFEETWAGAQNGDTAIQNGRWKMGNGVASGLTIINNPEGGPTGTFVQPHYATQTDLPLIISNENFTLPTEGIRLSFDVALEGGNANYFRLGIKATDAAGPYSNSYWVEIYSTMIRASKGTPGTPPTGGVANFSTHNYSSSTWPEGSVANVAMTIVPISTGGNEVSLYINGTKVVSNADINGQIPNLSSGFEIFVGARAYRDGYFTNVKLESIPEGGTVALLIGGAGALLAMKRLGFEKK